MFKPLLIVFLKIIASAFLSTFIIPNSYGFIVRTSMYNLDNYNPWLLFPTVIIAKFAALTLNYYLGKLFYSIPKIKNILTNQLPSFKAKVKILTTMNILIMLITPLWTTFFAPFSSLLLGTIGSLPKNTIPVLLASSVVQTFAMVPRHF